MRAILSSNTATDSGPTATLLRNEAWLTPAYAAQVASEAPIAGAGTQWQTWAAHQVVLSVTTSLGGDATPPAAPGAAARQVIARITPEGADGYRAPAYTEVVFVALEDTASGWRISAEQSS